MMKAIPSRGKALPCMCVHHKQQQDRSETVGKEAERKNSSQKDKERLQELQQETCLQNEMV